MTQPIAVPTLKLADVRDLATLPVWHEAKPSAAAVLGIGRTLAYGMADRGDLPTIRLGSRVVVPVPALLAMLGERSVPIGNQDLPPADQHEPATSHSSTPGALTTDARR
ncbi:helix-turn-helix domain-containing protein [Nocardioides dongxiaopingii]|uniref:helix-turn-helix domain-containing protein n=1 Tax=Nocardioides sp. S-1144 TaxID=2582905 RepID=UPI0016527AB6|nr:helix-turn-helix domain-containing protein [Nocardioides sp. S-1144]